MKNDTQINTYTNHPAYQEPIIRTKFHNQVRYILGAFVFVLVSLPLVTSGVLSILYGLYQIALSLYSLDIFNQTFLLKVLSPVIGYVAILIGIEFFYWARHLTRATSREFV